MSITIRTPTIDDADEIARVHNDSWRETYSAQLPEEFYDVAAGERRVVLWQRLLASDRTDRVVRVAIDGDRSIVGFAASGDARDESPPREKELFMIYVLASAHGSGAGQALLDAVLGDGPAMLWVAEDNPRAHAFYARNGFVDDGTRKVEQGIEALIHVRLVR